jgi:hypothetical protein
MLSGDILEILSQGKFELHKGDEGITIAMEAIVINTCNEAVFCIAKYDYLHLGYNNGDSKQLWTYPTNVNNPHLFRIDTSRLNP